jgi:Trk K+ transport system NAD-binding subunit
MRRRTRRTTFYVVLVVLTTALFTFAYNYGMGTWEGRPQPLYRSLEVVFQSFTTTGYGEDAPWQSLQMNLLVVGMQLAGIGLILTAVDVFAVPWLRGALSPTAPTRVRGMRDHVVVCEYTSRGEAFVEELEARDRPYVLVVSDAERATELAEAELPVVHGDPESVDVLVNAGVREATALVADAADDTNASIVLSARAANPDLEIVSLVEDATLAQYHRIAGADAALSPRQLLGESLAGQLPTTVTTVVDEGIEVGEDFQLVELAVTAESDLCGRRLRDAQVASTHGIHVVGGWFGSRFETPVDPDTELPAGTRLLLAGHDDEIERLRGETAAPVRRFAPQRVVVAGHGESGAAAQTALSETNSRLTVLDVEDGPGVDVVGDARDPTVLREAGVEDAAALVVAVGDDTTATFTTLIARDLNPDLHIVVRANDHDEVEKLYRAGADYVQSLATVSGRMMAATVFEGGEVLTYDRRIAVVRRPAGALVGQTLGEADVRAETGCTVVAVHRDGETVTDLDAEAFRFEAGDEVVLTGTDESVQRFERRFDV